MQQNRLLKEKNKLLEDMLIHYQSQNEWLKKRIAHYLGEKPK
jgi:hypothetical protein